MAKLKPGLVSVKVIGVPAIKAALESIEVKTRKRVIKNSVNQGIRIWWQALRAKAPVESGLLKKSIGRKSKTYRNSGVYVSLAGPRKGFGRNVEIKKRNEKGRIVSRHWEYRDPAYYAHLTEIHDPWMRRVYLSTKQQVTATAVKTLVAEMEKVMGESISQARAAA